MYWIEEDSGDYTVREQQDSWELRVPVNLSTADFLRYEDLQRRYEEAQAELKRLYDEAAAMNAALEQVIEDVKDEDDGRLSAAAAAERMARGGA